MQHKTRKGILDYLEQLGFGHISARNTVAAGFALWSSLSIHSSRQAEEPSQALLITLLKALSRHRITLLA